MATAFAANKSLDCRGTFCPVPIIQAHQAVASMTPGQVLEVIATDPGSQGDFVAFAKNTGHELLHAGEEGGVYRYYLRIAG